MYGNVDTDASVRDMEQDASVRDEKQDARFRDAINPGQQVGFVEKKVGE